jgi:3-methyladenine DNA glycosylase AlkD
MSPRIRNPTASNSTKKPAARKPKQDAAAVVATLKRLSNKATRDGMARYAIPSDNAFGVTVGAMRKLAKELGRSHELAGELWQTGWYEARMMSSLLDEPERVTPAQMDRWCRDFDSWAICDTVCFHLFDRTPHAFRKVEQWARWEGEFQKRAAFALLASLALHDKHTEDAPFAKCLPLVERAATDERNFVKKGVNWALRAVGRRSPKLRAASIQVAQRLADSPHATPRWVGKDALRAFNK